MDSLKRAEELEKMKISFAEVYEAYQIANASCIDEGGIEFMPKDFTSQYDSNPYPQISIHKNRVSIDFTPSFLLSVDKNRKNEKVVHVSITVLPGEDFIIKTEYSLDALKYVLPKLIDQNRDYEKTIKKEN